MQPLSVLTVHVQHKFNSNANTYFQYVRPEFFSYLMSHLCCMATAFPTDAVSGSLSLGYDLLYYTHHSYFQWVEGTHKELTN